MRWWRTFAGWAAGLVRRPALQLDSAPYNVLVHGLLGDALSVSGTTISRSAALRVPAIVKGRNMICSIATLPIVQKGPDNAVVPHSLLAQFDPNVPNIVHMSQTIEDLLFDAVAWWQVTARDFDGYPVYVRRVAPSSVSVDPPEGRSPAPLPSGFDPRGGVVYVDGKPVPGIDMKRFDSPNPALCDAGARTIRRALLLDAAAAMYAEDPRPLDYFRPLDGADEIDDEEALDIIEKWVAARRQRATGWVPKAMEHVAVQSPTPADLQLVQLQERAALECANLLGVDPEDLGVSTTSRTYANNVDRRRDRVNDVLAPYMMAVTDRLSMGDITKRGYLVKFVLDDYLRSNPTERWTVHEKEINLGVRSEAEVRAEEGYAGLPPARPAPAPVVPNDASALLPDGSLRRFDGAARFTADLPVQTFSVDSETRTIRGTALPYADTAKKGRVRFRFAPDSLSWGDVGRVKLLRDHDYGQPLGRALELSNADGGLQVAFKVARGADGDRALELAADGVLDGLSVGVDYGDEDIAVQEDGVIFINRADLLEVSLVAMPAFDSARVSRVAASKGGNMEDCPRCGTRHAPGAACALPAPPATHPGGVVLPPANGLQLDAGQRNALLAALLGGNSPAPVPADPGPAVVNPTGRPTAVVTEPEPYRFDRRGNIRRGSHEFSADLVAASKGDGAAYERALSFIGRQFDRLSFDIDRTDVTTLNPTRQRPDLYVDQREYRYPVWEAIEKGTLPDSTPFTFPKFNTSSSLVATHTEGQSPTAGTFTATSQTVTPTASSGRVEITREAWDQGGNPQMSGLIWRQMVRAWYESLEAAAVAVLDAASPTQIDLSASPGLADDDLDQALTDAFAGLQFVRGGFSMNKGFAQVDLYKAMIAAVDSTGRRLYPAIGPQNANGTVTNRWGSVDVNGVEFLPAWALAASGSVAASSYLFDSEAVHGWATAPQRLEFQYRVEYVDLAIWGYKAAAISDINGVREIVYDPA